MARSNASLVESLTAPGQAVSMSTAFLSTIGLGLSGTWSGTILVRVSYDGINFVTMATLSANQSFALNVAGMLSVQVVAQSGFNGNALVIMTPAPNGTAQGALPVGLSGASINPLLTGRLDGAGNVQADSAVNPILTGRLDGSGNVQADSGNQDIVILPSATRNALAESPNLSNRNAKGVIIYLRITQVSGTGGLELNIEAVDPASGAVEFLNQTPTAVSAVTGNLAIYIIYPGISATNLGANVKQVVPLPLPATWRVRVTPTDNSNYTYSVGASLIL